MSTAAVLLTFTVCVTAEGAAIRMEVSSEGRMEVERLSIPFTVTAMTDVLQAVQNADALSEGPATMSVP